MKIGWNVIEKKKRNFRLNDAIIRKITPFPLEGRVALADRSWSGKDGATIVRRSD